MEKTILIDEINYTITDDQMIHQVDELIFELKNGRELKHTFVGVTYSKSMESIG